ncbi:unnamed protein product, partial [Mesorhabditis belari]|uniref:Uncharacterized protein n=1 Tax=Mesorhabditis belari TaxID=2138241 RepID=A0AAF3ESN9_9BILA
MFLDGQRSSSTSPSSSDDISLPTNQPESSTNDECKFSSSPQSSPNNSSDSSPSDFSSSPDPSVDNSSDPTDPTLSSDSTPPESDSTSPPLNESIETPVTESAGLTEESGLDDELESNILDTDFDGENTESTVETRTTRTADITGSVMDDSTTCK